MATDPGPIWDEPVRGRTAEPGLLRLPGLEQLLHGIQGRTPAPPIHHLTGLRPSEAGIGRATFVMPATGWLQNPAGIFPGGVLAFLADAPFGAAVATGLPVGKVITTAELSMSFLRPATPSNGMLIARGSALHSGRSVGLSQVHVEDAEGRLLSHGTSRLVIIDLPVDETVPIPGPEPAIPDPPDPYLRPVRGTVYDPSFFDAASGLDNLRGFIEGRFDPPPLGYLIDGGPVAADEGRCTWRMQTSRWLSSPGLPLYGGAIALLADLALGGSIQTTLSAGTTYGMLDLKVQFVRPVFPGTGDLVAEAEVTHRGRSIAIANAVLRNAEGKNVAFATGSAMVVPGGVAQLVRAEPPAPSTDD